MKRIYYLTYIVLSIFLPACGNDQQSPEPTKEDRTAIEVSQGMTAVAEGDKTVSSPVKGEVAETLDAGIYTYIRLDDGAGMQLWAAVPKTDLNVGEAISLQGGDMVLENFKSSTLNRTFNKIIFATGVSRNDDRELPDEEATDGSGSGVPISGGSAGNVVPFAGIMVEKASGPHGHGVGEIFEKASAFDEKNVVVRGQVVKISKNIMGKNWIHIQDGTGDPEKNTHDLVVTTMGTAEKGDVVTVEGQVAADRDFGFGYKYDVIIEDAKIIKVEVLKRETI